MTIFLRREVTNGLVETLHGSYDALAVAWEEQAIERRIPKAPSRSTLYRWVADGVPTLSGGTDHRFFLLCGLLDVDPLVILDLERHGYFSKFARMRHLIYYRLQSMGGVATVLDMYRPAEIWPSDSIAQTCFGHGWHAHRLTNDDQWRNSGYILLRFPFLDGRKDHPRALHIAYRRIDSRDTAWRYYGTVMAIDGQTELYSESGAFQKASQVEKSVVQFRTYFGGRQVEWRIASLHESSMEIEYPSEDNSVVTFTW